MSVREQKSRVYTRFIMFFHFFIALYDAQHYFVTLSSWLSRVFFFLCMNRSSNNTENRCLPTFAKMSHEMNFFRSAHQNSQSIYSFFTAEHECVNHFTRSTVCDAKINARRDILVCFFFVFHRFIKRSGAYEIRHADDAIPVLCHVNHGSGCLVSVKISRSVSDFEKKY